ncbi:MAG TPA: hypothetical protein VH092_25965 [Urbifossiella sp.]|jgi:hypothetical protein|nr:hypothetical protein [Urbifossiella sp.]
MSDRKSPELDLAVLCSYVVLDGQSQPFSLNEPLHTVLAPADSTGKLPAPEFALYVQMTDEEAHGTYEFTVEVRTDTNIVIRPAAVEPVRVTFVKRYYPVRPFEHVFLIRDLVFDAPGGYHFHVMCGHASMSDRPNATRPAKLRVVRAESAGGAP